MKERPILFSAPMVRAILAGTKTKTRRVCKPAESAALSVVVGPFDCPELGLAFFGDEEGEVQFQCPYGRPGDRLWVRESWMPDPPIDDTWASTQWAGCSSGKIAGVPERFRHPAFCNYAASWLHGPVKWTPSIHMPRWASRILLEIVAVRVERLQDISEEDLAAEGIQEIIDAGVDHDGYPRDAYRSLWESINGPGSWAANPWVWCIEFKRVTP